VTGEASLARFRLFERAVDEASERLRTQPSDLASAVDRLLATQRSLEEQLRTLRDDHLRKEADVMAAQALGGRVIARRDGLEAGELRDLALAVRDHPGVEAVAVVGVTGPDRVALVVAATKASGVDARAAASSAAAALGGGGGGTAELATAGGRNVAGVEDALVRLADALGRGSDEATA